MSQTRESLTADHKHMSIDPQQRSTGLIGTNPKDLIGATKLPLHLIPRIGINAMVSGLRSLDPRVGIEGGWKISKQFSWSTFYNDAFSNILALSDGSPIHRESYVIERSRNYLSFPLSALAATAVAFKDGAQKYGPYNWRENPVLATVYISAALRHMCAMAEGEDYAEDSGALHAAHAIACLAILVDAAAHGVLADDRKTTIEPGSDQDNKILCVGVAMANLAVLIDGQALGTLGIDRPAQPGAYIKMANKFALDHSTNK